MRRAEILLAGFLCAAMLFSSCGKAEPESVSVFAMDTYMTVTVYDGDADEALSDAKAEIERLEKLWSVTDPESDIYRADHSGGAPVEVAPETAGLLSFALDMNSITGGALDVSIYPVLAEWGFTTGEYRVPSDERIEELLKSVDCSRIGLEGSTVTVPEGMSIDLGSVGKGETGDRICAVLKENGVTSALLDLGGNVQLIGSKPDGSDFKVGIRSPFDETTIARLELSDCCVITSGGYERFFTDDEGNVYWHILDPATGRPARSGLLSVTVVGESGRLCDALSTSLFVMGEDRAADLWRSRGDFDMVLITEDQRMLVTEGLEDKLTVSEVFPVSVEVIRP